MTAPTQSSKTSIRFKHPFLVLPFQKNYLSQNYLRTDIILFAPPQLYNLEAGIEDHKNRVKNAANMRKDIDAVFKTVSDANQIVQVLLTDDMKAELNQQVEELKERAAVSDKIDDRLKVIDEFNGKIKIYIGVLVELEKWNLEGRKRMDELLAGPAPGSSAEDRVLMTMELGEDITKQLELHAGQEVQSNAHFKNF